jgi:hypothetical protein
VNLKSDALQSFENLNLLKVSGVLSYMVLVDSVIFNVFLSFK